MAVTLVRLWFGPSGSMGGGVIPDFDSQLLDPAFSPSGLTNVDIPIAAYQAARSPRDLLALSQPVVAKSNAPVAAQIGLKIQAIDHADVATVTTKNQVIPQSIIDALAVLTAQRTRFLAAYVLDSTITFTGWEITTDAANASTVQAAQSIIDANTATVNQAVSTAQASYDTQFAVDPILARANLTAQMNAANVASVGP